MESSSLAGKNSNSWNSIQPSGLRCLRQVSSVTRVIFKEVQNSNLWNLHSCIFGEMAEEKRKEVELTQKLARKASGGL